MSDDDPGESESEVSNPGHAEAAPGQSPNDDATKPDRLDGSHDSGWGVWPRRLLAGVQWTVAIGAFWYVARDVDWTATAGELAGVPPGVVLAVLALTVAEFPARFSMWYALLNGRLGTSFETSARVDLVIKFVNHVVPSKASGHSVSPLVVRHYTDAAWSDAVSLAGLNTGLYATAYGVTALAGLVLFAPRLAWGWVVVLLASTGIYLLVGALVLLAGRRLAVAGRLVARFESLLRLVPRVGARLATATGSLPSFTEDSASVFSDLSSRPGVVGLYVLGWVGTLLLVPGARVWLLLTALGGGFSPAVLLPVVLVMAYSVTVLPLTPGGVGVAEASATAVFVALGVQPEIAAAVVLVDRTLGVYLPAVVGWVPAARFDVSTVLSRGS